MTDSTNACFAEMSDLRVGMFIHLDLGWMSHPFPLGSFRIASAEQIAVIRGLGLKRVRWSPEKSDQDDPQPSTLTGHGQGVVTLTGVAPDEEPDLQVSAADLPAPPTESEPERQHRHRREALAAQREAHRACERRFGAASSICRKMLEMAEAQTEQAGREAESLTRDLLGQIMVDEELSIRLLHETAGDKIALHAMNVSVISLLMGRVFNLGEEDMLDLGVGALMHDVGKHALPERVRHRDDHFTASETQYYQEHVAHGVSAGRRMGLRPGALLVIGQHHELADGTGFPLRLNSDRMSAASRIVSLVNRYDNLCNPHTPSKSLTPHEALSLLFAQGKNKFDTAIMGAFIKMMGVYPPGSVVQLTDDRHALVTSVNSTRPLKPRVLVHDTRVPRDEALLVDLEQTPGLGIRRSLKPQQLPREALAYLSPRQRVTYYFEPTIVAPAPAEEIAS